MDLPTSLIRQSIKRGSILLSDSFDDIDYSNFYVVIGIYDDSFAGFFFINSRIHPIVMSKPAQFDMQYPLRKKDYDFLRYDSFLGANELQVRELSVLVASLVDWSTTLMGEMTSEDLDYVLSACRESDLFSPKEKKQYFY